MIHKYWYVHVLEMHFQRCECICTPVLKSNCATKTLIFLDWQESQGVLTRVEHSIGWLYRNNQKLPFVMFWYLGIINVINVQILNAVLHFVKDFMWRILYEGLYVKDFMWRIVCEGFYVKDWILCEEIYVKDSMWRILYQAFPPHLTSRCSPFGGWRSLWNIWLRFFLHMTRS